MIITQHVIMTSTHDVLITSGPVRITPALNTNYFRCQVGDAAILNTNYFRSHTDIAFFNLQFIPVMFINIFSTRMWALFLKFNQKRCLRATFVRVLSFPAGGLPYFGTSIYQTIDGDGGMLS